MEASKLPLPPLESSVSAPIVVISGPEGAVAEGGVEMPKKEEETKPEVEGAVGGPAAKPTEDEGAFGGAEAKPAEEEGAFGGPAANVEEGQDVSICLKTVMDSHNAVEEKLQDALGELALKQKEFYDLKEALEHQNGKNRLMQERIHTIDEKLFFAKALVAQKEKRQEAAFAEIADVKWKIEEAKKLRAKIKSEQKELKKKAQKRKAGYAKFEDPKGALATRKKELKEYIDKLEDYKRRLQTGDPEAQAVMDGSKLKELEQSKLEGREALSNRQARCDALHLVVDEKTVQKKKCEKSLENAKEYYGSEIRQLKSKLGFTNETNLRLERSFDYLQQKIDYGMHVPAPPPWPYTKKQN